MATKITRILCILLLFSFVSNAQTITYRGLGKGKNTYNTELLQLIFDSAVPNTYTVKLHTDYSPHFRAFKSLETNEKVNIVIGYATNERVKKHLSIPLPIRKGIDGWRVSLIHKDNRDIFKNVSTLEQLQNYTPGQFHSWTDNSILKSNNIIPNEGSSLDGLLKMLDKKRFDYFPLAMLSATENSRQLKEIKMLGLEIMLDPYILISYPTCFYFYVNKSNKALAEIINNGFENIIANGKFDKLFDKYYGRSVDNILESSRKLIQLQNPLLPINAPINRKELWLNEGSYKLLEKSVVSQTMKIKQL